MLERAQKNDGLATKKIIYVFLVPMLMVHILALILIISWEKKRSDEEQIYEMTELARGFYQQIAVARSWNAGHGGVYAEINENTQPNPYLDADDREIVAANGKRYAKINPAYMTRQLSGIADKSHGYRFRLVGLKPLNPGNTPDRWEAGVLKMFEQGAAEDASMTESDNDGQRIFKYMVLLRTERPCLKCHEKYGSVLGDVRGGISISVPMAKYDLLSFAKLRRTVIYMLLISVFSMILTGVIVRYFIVRLNRTVADSIEKEKLSVVLELAGAAAHEMRQPMTIIHSIIALMEDRIKNRELITEEEMSIVSSQCRRMNNTIDKMLNITKYSTKEYLPGKNILDLDAASVNASASGGTDDRV